MKGLRRHDIEAWFKYHAPNETQIGQYALIRDAGKNLALRIYDNCPSSADRTAAIRKVREAVMTANAAIACENELGEGT